MGYTDGYTDDFDLCTLKKKKWKSSVSKGDLKITTWEVIIEYVLDREAFICNTMIEFLKLRTNLIRISNGLYGIVTENGAVDISTFGSDTLHETRLVLNNFYIFSLQQPIQHLIVFFLVHMFSQFYTA